MAQPLADHAGDNAGHHVRRVTVPVIVPPGKFPSVAVQVLLRELAECSLAAPLQSRPETLDPAGVSHVPDMLAGAVVHALMTPIHADVSAAIIGADPCLRLRPTFREVLQSLCPGVRHHLRGNLAGFTILCTRNDGLSDATASGIRFPALVPVLLQAADATGARPTSA